MQRLPLDNVVFLPLDHVMLGMEIWRRSTLRLYVSWNFVFGAIIIGFYHWGGLCVVCSSCHRSAVPMGMVCAHRGFHPFRGFHRFRGFSPTAVVLRTYGALYGAQQRFSVTGDFWGDVSEETDFIFTKCRLVYIINFVDLWSK